MISSRTAGGRLPPGAATIQKLAAPLATRPRPTADGTMWHLELPQAWLDVFIPPLAQRGYEITLATLPPARTLGRSVSYTLAKKVGQELQFLNLPPIFFKPKEDIGLMASGLFTVFDPNPRLHLFAEGKQYVLAYFDDVIKFWNRKGVPVTFHPWSRLEEVKAAPDPVGFVTLRFDLDGNGAAASSNDLPREQYNTIYESLMKVFYSYDRLRTMVRLELGKNLSTITPEAKDLGINVQDVIDRAVGEGWIGDIVLVAVKSDSKNDELRRVAHNIGVDLDVTSAD
jgi:hypothetical protein